MVPNKQALLCSISMHVDKAHLFNKHSRQGYSEADYQIKFWGFVFESFFYSNDYM